MADLTVNHLRRHHQEARSFLAQLKSLLQLLTLAPQWTPEHRETFQQLARFFEGKLCLLVHKEDQILYPALYELFPPDVGPLAVLRGEHRALCSNFRKLSEIGNSLRTEGNPPEILDEFQRLGRKAAEVLEDHLYKEERVLLPMAARFLTSERDAELLRQMESLRPLNDQHGTSELQA
jgi:iron-sulfur cluster repair protein YtfE (RIC family)